jgi:hypothetical protein
MPRNEDDTRKMWIGAQLDEPIYNALFRLATELGVHPSLAAEIGVEFFIENYTLKEEDPDFLITQMSIRHKRRQHSVATIKQMAIAHLNDPTEESADELAAACDSIGMSVESIVDVMSEKEYIGQIVNQRGKDLNDVEMWLAETIKPDREYKASEIFRMGLERGYSKDRVRKARTALGIDSKRRSGHWAWFWPEGTPDREIDEEVDSQLLPGMTKPPPDIPF